AAVGLYNPNTQQIIGPSGVQDFSITVSATVSQTATQVYTTPIATSAFSTSSIPTLQSTNNPYPQFGLFIAVIVAVAAAIGLIITMYGRLGEKQKSRRSKAKKPGSSNSFCVECGNELSS